jgi:uncharacterized membrane protein
MQQASLYSMAFLYLLAGFNHFWHPRFYLKIMPPRLPWHKTLVIISGIGEMVLGLLLLVEQTRSFAAWGIIVLLLAVFPANIQMMLNYKRKKHPLTWITIARLPLQVVLIWWAYGFTGL